MEKGPTTKELIELIAKYQEVSGDTNVKRLLNESNSDDVKKILTNSAEVLPKMERILKQLVSEVTSGTDPKDLHRYIDNIINKLSKIVENLGKI